MTSTDYADYEKNQGRNPTVREVDKTIAPEPVRES
jgi:hypothetical protein